MGCLWREQVYSFYLFVMYVLHLGFYRLAHNKTHLHTMKVVMILILSFHALR